MQDAIVSGVTHVVTTVNSVLWKSYLRNPVSTMKGDVSDIAVDCILKRDGRKPTFHLNGPECGIDGLTGPNCTCVLNTKASTLISKSFADNLLFKLLTHLSILGI